MIRRLQQDLPVLLSFFGFSPGTSGANCELPTAIKRCFVEVSRAPGHGLFCERRKRGLNLLVPSWTWSTCRPKISAQ
jgi:hypothetical protein